MVTPNQSRSNHFGEPQLCVGCSVRRRGCRAKFRKPALGYLLLLIVLITQPDRHPLQSQQTDEYESLGRRVVRLYQEGKYEEAIPLAEKARQVALETRGVESGAHSVSLNDLALLYQEILSNVVDGRGQAAFS